MKFDDLKDFIENSMRMHGPENYQPVVIAALVQNGGSATREELKIQLQKANPERDLDHFSQCPAFDIIIHSVERVGNVLYNGDKIAELLRDNDTFRMLDFDSYTNTQKAWILVECALKDKEKREFLEQSVKRTKEEIETDSRLTTDKKQVLKDYSSEFFTKKLTKEKLLEFCLYSNNHHWKDISRPVGKIDEKKLPKALKIILNEKESVSERIQKIRDEKSGDHTSDLSYAIYTPILLVTSNLKHPVINSIVLSAIDKLGFFPKKKFDKLKEWESVPLMQEIVREVANRYELDLWQMDWVWWKLAKNVESDNSSKNYWLLIPGWTSDMKDQMMKENPPKFSTVTIGFHDADLNDYFGDPDKVWKKDEKSFNSKAAHDELLKNIRVKLEAQYKSQISNLKKKQKTGKLSKAEKDDLAKLQKGVHHTKVSWDWMPMRTFMRAEINDGIILWNGRDKIFAIGEIIGEYEYKKTLPKDYQFADHHHQREVKWTDIVERTIPDNNKAGNRIVSLGRKPTFDYANQKKYALLMDHLNLQQPPSKPMDDYAEELDILDWEKNLILYGPPGTGKTYHAHKIAETLVRSKFEVVRLPHTTDDRAEISNDYHQKEYGKLDKNEKKEVDKLAEKKSKDFIFNGIKTKAADLGYTLNEKTDPAHYSLERGNHKIHLVFHKSAHDMQNSPPEDCYLEMKEINMDFFKEVSPENRFLVFLNNSTNNFVILPHNFYHPRMRFSNSVTGKWDPTGLGANSFRLKIERDKITFPTNDGYRANGGPDSANCDFFMRNINVIFGTRIQNITFHQSYSYEEFMEGIKPKLRREDENDPSSKKFIDYVVEPGIFKEFCNLARYDFPNPYVMIIDEINRGNISKIFGELITVIEKDKRGMSVKLTYSKETFDVPPNVFLICTMNTADRSIALLDTALTRRFARKEIMPDSSVIKDEHKQPSIVDGINLQVLLDALNEKILGEDTTDNDVRMRERQIGHSYLMDGEYGISDISTLRLAFIYDILPLLRELLFDDDELLQSIIGTGFIDWTKKDINPDLVKHLIKDGHNHADDAFKKELAAFMEFAKPKEVKEAEDKPEEKELGEETESNNES